MDTTTAARVGHFATQLATVAGYRDFRSGLGRLEQTQRERLSRLLTRVAAVDSRIDPRWRWEDFVRRVPVTGWEDWRVLVERQRACSRNFLVDSPVHAWRPTAGPASPAKWVPYTRLFLGELDAAIGPWVSDVYRRHPGVGRGTHYWSMPWLPPALREPGQRPVQLADGPLLSPGMQWAVRRVSAVPAEVGLARTAMASRLQALAYLAADAGLSALFVRSPMQLAGLLERLGQWRGPIAETLGEGRWSPLFEAGLLPRCPRSGRASALLNAWDGSADPDFFRALWPQLAFVSAWDGAASANWAGEVRRLLSGAAFEARGLWATEGIVSVPFGGRCLLAYRSHVVEFEDLHDGRVLAPWQVREGQQVVPVLSTGSGLLRYRLEDVLEVAGFEGTVPALDYVGRDAGCDLSGERLTAAQAVALIRKVVSGSGMRPVCLLALDEAAAGLPGYVLLLEGDREVSPVRQALVAGMLERALCRHMPYAVARSLGRLGAARVVCGPRLSQVFSGVLESAGLPQGIDGIGSLHRWKGKMPGRLAALLCGALADPTPPVERVPATFSG